MAQLKLRYGLKIAVVSNESRELNAFRIRKFKLDGFVDFFISSCFCPRSQARRGHLPAGDGRGADARRAGRLTSTTHQCLSRSQKASGIRSILHTEYESTCAQLSSFGLPNDEGVLDETG